MHDICGPLNTPVYPVATTQFLQQLDTPCAKVSCHILETANVISRTTTKPVVSAVGLGLSVSVSEPVSGTGYGAVFYICSYYRFTFHRQVWYPNGTTAGVLPSNSQAFAIYY